MAATIEKFCASGVYDPPGYSQGIKVTGAQTILFLAGQVSYDKDGTPKHKGDFKAQARECFECLKRLVEAGGGTVKNIVKVNTYVTDIANRSLYRGAQGVLRRPRARVDDGADQRACGPRLPDRDRGDRRHLTAPSMTVSVTFFADLRRYLPKGADGPQRYVVPAGATVADLLATIGVDAAYDITVAVTASRRPRDEAARGAEIMLLSPDGRRRARSPFPKSTQLASATAGARPKGHA